MKKVIYILAFMLMCSFSFASNVCTNQIETNQVDFLGICKFTYEVIATNVITGEQKKYTFTRTVEADSKAQCDAYSEVSRQLSKVILNELLN